jgi:hypothetical protein
MKKITVAKATITAAFLALYGAVAFAQGLPVSASYEAPVSASAVADDVSSPSVSATATAQDVSAPYIGAMDCCTVSNPVSSPRMAAQDDGSDSLAMAGLGFGLFGLVGVTKWSRRKKQK